MVVEEHAAAGRIKRKKVMGSGPVVKYR